MVLRVSLVIRGGLSRQWTALVCRHSAEHIERYLQVNVSVLVLVLASEQTLTSGFYCLPKLTPKHRGVYGWVNDVHHFHATYMLEQCSFHMDTEDS